MYVNILGFRSSGMLTQHCLVVNRHFVRAYGFHLQRSSRMPVAMGVRSGIGGVTGSSTFPRQPLATYTIFYIISLPPDVGILSWNE